MSWAGAYHRLMRGLEPLSGALLKRRIKSGKEDAARISERKGIASLPRPIGQLIWMHGASVGETTMLLPLIEKLLSDDPKLHILVTSGTVTSSALMAERLPERAFHQFVPLDGPSFVDRFLAHWQPDLAIWAESEIWPNLIQKTKSSGAKMALINARFSQKSLDGWHRKSNFARELFSCFDVILPADQLTHETLKTFGGNVMNEIHNLKQAAPRLDFDKSEATTLKKQFGKRPIWLAASTHEPEDASILEAHEYVTAKNTNALLIWVPRHPERGQYIARLCEGLNITVRSNGDTPSAETSIYLMDTLGEMGLALELADVAFIGGSLHKSLTGHNPLEPARARVPILTGPHVASFTDLYENLFHHNAAMPVTSAQHLGQTVVALLNDGAASGQMARRAEKLVEENDHILDYTLGKLRALL